MSIYYNNFYCDFLNLFVFKEINNNMTPVLKNDIIDNNYENIFEFSFFKPLIYEIQLAFRWRGKFSCHQKERKGRICSLLIMYSVIYTRWRPLQ